LHVNAEDPNAPLSQRVKELDDVRHTGDGCIFDSSGGRFGHDLGHSGGPARRYHNRIYSGAMSRSNDSSEIPRIFDLIEHNHERIGPEGFQNLVRTGIGARCQKSYDTLMMRMTEESGEVISLPPVNGNAGGTGELKDVAETFRYSSGGEENFMHSVRIGAERLAHGGNAVNERLPALHRERHRDRDEG
jgi:hypothetical protein